MFNTIILAAAIAGILGSIFAWGFATDAQRSQFMSLCWIHSCDLDAQSDVATPAPTADAPNAVPSFAQLDPIADNSHWSHNGSVMYLRIAGPSRRIYYLQPRRGMLDAGAQPDSLLFDGTDSNGRWSGSARVFNKRCGRQYPYLVEGGPRDGNAIIELVGHAPRVGQDCEVAGYGGSNDDLIFALVRS